ncbi:helix-turn-helix transcriptional regulator [Methanotorris igneus]|uniref:Transcriptional regulator TrmB n=1 Tax=Methanotorris igneus (strain DSM 5666 / JCM 11834 / Kol 5) TaxID=880724 RepID=F6BBZ6_METIK|nr:winged helix-turn-helix transcriptional regulator [Methanotorris igneus]AEF96077.1 transcriptional regulator TrmB [Methanotorris igneus Kol 5]
MNNKIKLNETDKKVLDFILENGESTRQEIIDALGVKSGSLTNSINKLEKLGYIKTEKQGNQTVIIPITPTQPSIHNDNTNIIHLDFSKIKSLTHLRDIINSHLRANNWSIGNYDLVITALIIAKFTQNLRLLIFGSQGIGKTCCIKAVFPDNDGFIEYDLHRKQLKEVVNLREHIRIIEQQYRHTWGAENPATFDQYTIVPLSRIAPSDLVFRFIPIRVLQYKYVPNYRPVVFDISNFKLIEPPLDVYDKLHNIMKHLLYFNNCDESAKSKIRDFKYREILSLYSLTAKEGEFNLNAEQWKIERKYERYLENPFRSVNLRVLQEDEEMWFRASLDMQLMRNSYEVLRFAFSISRSEDAIGETYDFIKEILATWTKVRDERPKRRDRSKVKVRSEAQSYYVDSQGVVHNVV